VKEKFPSLNDNDINLNFKFDIIKSASVMREWDIFEEKFDFASFTPQCPNYWWNDVREFCVHLALNIEKKTWCQVEQKFLLVLWSIERNVISEIYRDFCPHRKKKHEEKKNFILLIWLKKINGLYFYNLCFLLRNIFSLIMRHMRRVKNVTRRTF
jgi:hypothetical protein